MTWEIEILILTLTVLCAVTALQLKDLLGAAIVFGAYSFFLCILWVGMGAVDVAFTEATVGAGISTVLFVATSLHITRRTKD